MCGKVIKRQIFKRKYNKNKKRNKTLSIIKILKKTRKIFFYEKLKKVNFRL